ERVLAGVAELLVVVPLGEVFRRVERFDLGAAGGLEALAPLLRPRRRLRVGRFTPLVLGLAHGCGPRCSRAPAQCEASVPTRAGKRGRWEARMVGDEGIEPPTYRV